MNASNDSLWLHTVISRVDGYEAEAVQRFMDRLVRLAKSKLPARLTRRVDAEDIVQSVFVSFFDRHRNEAFTFKNSNDLWRLLAAMTYRKTLTAIEFHSRQRRNFVRDSDASQRSAHLSGVLQSDDATASAVAVMIELLDQILQRLPVEHQHILQLRLEDFSIEEIANRANVSARTVNRALKSARLIATQLLEKNEEC